jgi:hypothetical protein
MQKTLVSEISNAIVARRNCQESGNTEWFANWSDRLAQLADMLPHGSGIDSGTKIDLDASHEGKIVLYTSFHHMNDGGYYDGWTEHTITVTPSFSGINLRIYGRNRNDIKSYLYDIFSSDLQTEVVWDTEKEGYVRAA